MAGILRAPVGVKAVDFAPPRSVRCSIPSVKSFAGAPLRARQFPVARIAYPSVVAAAAAAPELEAPVEDKKDLEATAILRFTRGSPHKMRRVLDQIRGCTYEEALIILEYMPYRACEPILKTVVSAAANAKHNLGLKKSKLYVSECFADGGPVMKRVKFRAKGRADRIRKPTSHITIKMKERA
ncbi:hypothetical protein BSKO_13902 [Bryopsis sp. KO-2023]|nr:hypothetical protein BSKO_13902 [Bryopsis sp. KO-2023]